MPASGAPEPARSRQRGGRPPTHGLTTLKKAVTALGTRRLDGRSTVAVAARRWKEDIRRDLGGDLTRAQETLLELAARAWVIVSSLDDYIGRQPSLVTRKRQVLPVVTQRMQIADSLARHLERLGLERKAKDMPNLADYIASRDGKPS